MIHIKSQDLFSLKNKKKIIMSSAAVLIGALKVKVPITTVAADTLKYF